MTGTSCAFILTKSLDLPLYYFFCFLYMYNYTIIDSLVKNGYRETSSYFGGFDLRDA
jgi:hypothetical protein